MNWKRHGVLCVTAILVAGGSAFAQKQEFVDQYEEMYAKREPHVGMKLDDFEAYNEQGDELNLKDLKGKYAVLTFGCMT